MRKIWDLNLFLQFTFTNSTFIFHHILKLPEKIIDIDVLIFAWLYFLFFLNL